MKLRPWDLNDAVFVCYLRNGPLRRWFRQEQPIDLDQQREFMRTHLDYHGYIFSEKHPLGVIALYYHQFKLPELSYVGDVKYFKEAFQLLLAKEQPELIEAPMFAENPLLKTLLDCGFKVNGVKERAHYKQNYGLQDLIYLEYLHKPTERKGKVS